MAELTKQALKVENNTEFPNNNNGQITPSRLRTFNEDMIDSTVNQAVYTADSASFDSRIDAISGSVAVDTGSLLTTASFDNGTRNLTFTKGDASTFAVNIPDVSGSTGNFATTGSNSFNGNQTISGSVDVSGSVKQTFNTPTLGNQTDLVLLKGATINGVPFSQQTISVQNYDFGVDTYKSAFVIEAWDSLSYNFGGEILVNGETTQLQVVASGSAAGTTRSGIIGISDNGNSKTKAVLTGQIIEIGGAGLGLTNATAESITIGRAGINTVISGSLSITPASVSANTVFPIPFLSSSVVSVDSVQTLQYNPSLNRLEVSGSAGASLLSQTNLLVESGSGAGLHRSNISRGLINNFVEGGNIAMSGNPSKLPSPALAAFTNPAILGSNSSGVLYPVIELQTSQSFTDGRVTVTRPLVLQQGGIITGSLTASVITFPTGSLGNGINLFQDGLSQIRFYSGSTTTEVGTWVNMQVNPSNGALAISSFPSNNHFVDFDVSTTSSIFDAPIRGLGGTLRIGSNTTITGSLTISGSANNDLIVEGRQSIIGKGGFAPTLTISGSSHRNTIGQRVLEIAKPGFDYPVFLSQYTDQSSSILLNFTENLSQTASYTVGVFDNAFTQDVELSLETTTTNGVQFKDIRSDTGAYVTFLKIAPNGGSNPPLEFKRGMQVTGSLTTFGDVTLTSATAKLELVSATSIFKANNLTGSWGQTNDVNFNALKLDGSLSIQSGSSFFANGNKQFNVGAFSSLVTQSGSAGVSQSVNFDTTDKSEGVSIASNSQITLANSGTYSITFSAQVLADGGQDTLWMWLKKNGTNVANTSTKIIGKNGEETVLTVNYVVDAVANDYYELAWENLNGYADLLFEGASGNYPAIPSVILTVTQVR
jgi:hypothetical protein